VIRRKGSSREPDVTTPRKSDKRDPFLHYIPKIRTTIHEIIIRNQLMQLDPPLDYARANLISRLNDWLGECESISNVHVRQFVYSTRSFIHPFTLFSHLQPLSFFFLLMIYYSCRDGTTTNCEYTLR
jgi:hypothetical protein